MLDLESQIPLEFFRKSSKIILRYRLLLWQNSDQRSSLFYLLHFIFGIFQIFHRTVFLQSTFLTISILGNKHLSSLYKSALFATVTWHEVCREMSNKDEVIIVLQVPHDSLYSTPLFSSSNVRNQTIEKDWRSFYFYLSIDIYRIDPCWL